jgi:hypothetical protein
MDVRQTQGARRPHIRSKEVRSHCKISIIITSHLKIKGCFKRRANLLAGYICMYIHTCSDTLRDQIRAREVNFHIISRSYRMSRCESCSYFNTCGISFRNCPRGTVQTAKGEVSLYLINEVPQTRSAGSTSIR